MENEAKRIGLPRLEVQVVNWTDTTNDEQYSITRLEEGGEAKLKRAAADNY